jgi:hypothetical protein
MRCYAKLHTTMAVFGFKALASTSGKLPPPIIRGVRRYAKLYTPFPFLSLPF